MIGLADRTMPRNILRGAAVFFAAVFSLSACGGGKITPDAEYESIDDLRSAYLRSDVSDEDCDEPNKDAAEEWGTESATCGMHTVLVVYLSDDAKKMDEARGYNGPDYIDKDSSIVSGPNWYIRTQTWNAKNVQKVFGGTVTAGRLES